MIAPLAPGIPFLDGFLDGWNKWKRIKQQARRNAQESPAKNPSSSYSWMLLSQKSHPSIPKHSQPSSPKHSHPSIPKHSHASSPQKSLLRGRGLVCAPTQAKTGSSSCRKWPNSAESFPHRSDVLPDLPEINVPTLKVKQGVGFTDPCGSLPSQDSL